MCGVIGLRAEKYNRAVHAAVIRLLVESQVRGKHATGVVEFFNGNHQRIVAPFPAKEFVKLLLFREEAEGKPYSIIGHTRYSTSDLLFNQPIELEKSFIAHNGVISQADPSEWEIPCLTRNDSELLGRSIERGEVLGTGVTKEASIAFVQMRDDGDLIAYRNGKRPLWHSYFEGMEFVASTKDILMRVFPKCRPKPLKPGVAETLGYSCYKLLSVDQDKPDLQYAAR